MGRPDPLTRDAITRRRAAAVDLKLAGVDWLTIARKLAADPSINSDGIAYPQGYGIARYTGGLPPPPDGALAKQAARDVTKALDARRTAFDADVDQLRALHAERLERLFFVVYRTAVTKGDLGALDRALRIMERTAKLLGLDRPAQTHITGPGAGPAEASVPLSELERLIGLAGDPAPPTVPGGDDGAA